MRAFVGIVVVGLGAGAVALLALRDASPARALSSAAEVLVASAPSALVVPRTPVERPAPALESAAPAVSSVEAPTRDLDEKSGPSSDARARVSEVRETPAPAIDAWVPEGPRCRRRGCDGPRRVPIASGENLARAQRFDLVGEPGEGDGKDTIAC